MPYFMPNIVYLLLFLYWQAVSVKRLVQKYVLISNNSNVIHRHLGNAIGSIALKYLQNHENMLLAKLCVDLNYGMSINMKCIKHKCRNMSSTCDRWELTLTRAMSQRTPFVPGKQNGCLRNLVSNANWKQMLKYWINVTGVGNDYFEMIFIWYIVSAFINIPRMFPSLDFLLYQGIWHVANVIDILYIKFMYQTKRDQQECLRLGNRFSLWCLGPWMNH